MERGLFLAAVGEAATGMALLIAPTLVGWFARGSQLNYLRFQTAGITGTNRLRQADF